MTPYGTLMWTASSAGWCVLAHVTGVPEAWFVAAGCGIMAFIWYQIQRLGN